MLGQAHQAMVQANFPGKQENACSMVNLKIVAFAAPKLNIKSQRSDSWH